MSKYHTLVLPYLLFALIGCNSTEKIKVKVQENNVTTKLHLREEDNATTKAKKTIPKIEMGESELNLELNNYLQALNHFDIDTVVEMTYPKLFWVIDRNLFRQYLSSMLKAKDINMQSYTATATNIAPIRAFSNDTQFSQVDYHTEISILLLNEQLYNTDEKMNFLYDVLIHKYGQENIKIDKAQRTLTIQREEKLIMIKENGEAWKFLGDNSRYRQLYPSILPPEILNNLY